MGKVHLLIVMPKDTFLVVLEVDFVAELQLGYWLVVLGVEVVQN